jgi:hypothetical protein
MALVTGLAQRGAAMDPQISDRARGLVEAHEAVRECLTLARTLAFYLSETQRELDTPRDAEETNSAYRKRLEFAAPYAEHVLPQLKASIEQAERALSPVVRPFRRAFETPARVNDRSYSSYHEAVLSQVKTVQSLIDEGMRYLSNDDMGFAKRWERVCQWLKKSETRALPALPPDTLVSMLEKEVAEAIDRPGAASEENRSQGDANRPAEKFGDASKVTAEYRDLGRPDGEPLTAEYLKDDPDWRLNKSMLTRKLKNARIKVGRAFVYKYDAALVLRESSNA